jgi:hypothetical protein
VIRFILLPSSLILLSALAQAQPRVATPKDDPAAAAANANADSRFSLTVYSTADPATFDPQEFLNPARDIPNQPIPGFGVVREIRKLALTRGDNQVKFADVAAAIDPTTVAFKSLTAPDSTAVLEQNYEFDLVNPDKLLEKYLGKSVIINRKQDPLPNDRSRMPETIEARLLAFTPDQLVLETNNKQLPVQVIPRNADITEIKLFDLKTGLITKPTLLWRLTTDHAGDHDVMVSYQTDNITWRADYGIAMNHNETAADLSAWVTLVNQSGAAYPNAKLKLVAGDVQRLKPERPRAGYFGGAAALRAERDTGFQEKAFSEYHLYTLGRPTSIPNNSTKQIELFPPRANLPVTKTYVYYGADYGTAAYAAQPLEERDVRDPGNKKVDVYLQLKNAEKNGLGLPLPAGRVRVYKRDAADNADDPAGLLEFIGEDKIDHTPKDEDLLIRIGSAFDIVGQRKQTDFTTDRPTRTITESFEIKLRNHKTTPVTVIVRENLFRWHTWQITAASDKYTKHDARTIHLPIDLPAGGEKTITYTVKYTW